MECETEHKSKTQVERAKLITWKSSQQTTDILTEKTKATVYAHVATNAPLCEPDREVEDEDKVHELRSSGAVWKSMRWPSWAPVPNKPTVSVDVKQHFNQQQRDWAAGLRRGGSRSGVRVLLELPNVIPVRTAWMLRCL